MATFIFKGEKPPKLNLDVLRSAVEGVAPGVSITFKNGVSWERWPYSGLEKPEYLDEPENPAQPYIEPDVLIFENVPDGITRAQVRNFIQNHAPGKSTEEARRETKADDFLDLLMNASDSKRSIFLNWLNS